MDSLVTCPPYLRPHTWFSPWNLYTVSIVPYLFSILYSRLYLVLVLLRAWAIWGCDRRVAVILIGSYSVYLLLFLVQAIFSATSITSESAPITLYFYTGHRLLVRTFQYAGLPEICVTVIPRTCLFSPFEKPRLICDFIWWRNLRKDGIYFHYRHILISLPC